jgi:hypothetical protein
MSSSPSRRVQQVGLDRLVRLAWLEQTASLVLAGNDDHTIKVTLQEDLRGFFRSSAVVVRGSLDKTITILQKVWGNPQSEIAPLHADGLELLTRFPPREHAPIHWGMLMAAYPFWSSVATQTGRLLRIQGTAAAAQVQRRIREQYGERETVARRARYVLRSYLDWGVLQETGAPGVYRAAPPHAINDPKLIAWLTEAALWARANGAAPLRELLEGPSLFPFQLMPTSPEHLASLAPRLELLRHGLNDDLVMLRREGNS